MGLRIGKGIFWMAFRWDMFRKVMCQDRQMLRDRVQLCTASVTCLEQVHMSLGSQFT